ncbi:MAG: hypothetical protein EPN93_17975 [Spirochaetes bacterium]|nr:MAG: hypothetical protein EPN93_17975 [Spirochaetota bacterium]
MFENIAALDIGSSSIKMITIRTSLRNFQITSMTYEDIGPGDTEDASPIAATLGKMLEENPLKGYTVFVNLPMEKAIIRNITFPFSDLEKIRSAIPFEAEENIPFRMDELSMDFQSLRGSNPEEGRILLAASHKDQLRDLLAALQECGIQPVRMGLEANALFECYRYFNRVGGESVIQLDIGHSKTVVNVIRDNFLIYTRCITLGTSDIYREIATAHKMTLAEAGRLFEELNLDLTSLENNLQREYYKTLGITRPRLKRIYETSCAVVDQLIEQVAITLKSFAVEYGSIEFGRMLISGGGSNIAGLGMLLSRSFNVPVAGLPFLPDYTERKIQSQFPIVFGTVLSYLDRRQASINFLKGEFLPDFVSNSRKIYYFAGAVGVAAAIVLAVNLVTAAVINYRTSSEYSALLNDRFQKYFHTKPAEADPVKAAQKLVNDEKKDVEAIDNIIQSDERLIDLMKGVVTAFPGDDGFVLTSVVVNDNSVRIDGTVGTVKTLDDYRNRLVDTKKYDSVNFTTNQARANQTTFTMIIKQKIRGGKAKPAERGEAK